MKPPIRESFVDLLNNRPPKERDRGFIVFVHGASDLALIENICFEQTYNSCATARYASRGANVILPLLTTFLDDYLASSPGSSQVSKQGGAPTGHFRPGLEEKPWPAIESLRQETWPDEPGEWLSVFFEQVDRNLDTGERLILLCEVADTPDDMSLEDFGFTPRVLEALASSQPERFGLVISGIPDERVREWTQELQSWFSNRYLTLDVTGEDVYAAPPEAKLRSQPLARDSASGEDQLMVEAEIQTIADAVAAGDMKPPLVVGVLGGWGAGKSFVLHLLEQRLLAIRTADISDPSARDAFPYVGHLYLIRFDAWSFAKADLWASLTQQILSELNHQIGIEQLLLDMRLNPLRDTQIWRLLFGLSPMQFARLSDTEQGREAIKSVAQLEGAMPRAQRLWSEFRRRTKEDRQLLAAKEGEQAELSATIAAEERRIEREVDEKLRQDQELVETFGAVSTRLKAPVWRALESTMRDKGLDLGATRDEFVRSVSLWRRATSGGPRRLVALALIILAGIAAVILAEAAVKAVGAAAAIVVPLAAALRFIRSANDELSDAFVDYDEARLQVEQERANGRAATIAERQATDLQELWDKAAKVEGEVESLRSRVGMTQYPTLLEFLNDRLAAGEYQRRLGLLHQVQRDIAELSDALLYSKPGSVQEPDGTPTDNADALSENGPQDETNATDLFPRGDPRVVLLIDDLDRCPPGRVVEVLEAAQLLVKTELFVVVLAMDVRYVTRALEKAYRGVLERDGRPSGLDYIEKIVQIPYRVRPISEDAMSGYLESQVSLQPDASAGQAKIADMIYGDDRPLPAEITSPDKVDGVALDPLPLEIQLFDRNEIELLKACALEARTSPRSTKRLVNVYKLMKNIWYRLGVSPPEEPVKRAMLLLLAAAAEYPSVMGRLLFELERNYVQSVARQPRKKLSTQLRTDVETWSEREGRKADWTAVNRLLGNAELLDPKVTLKQLTLENVRIIQSFSFVGEVDIPPDPETHQVELVHQGSVADA